jgi:hypothetical protein
MFCAPRLVFDGTEGVVSVFMFCATVFVFCAPRVVSHDTEGVESRFHILRSLTRFKRFRGRRDPFSSFARPD